MTSDHLASWSGWYAFSCVEASEVFKFSGLRVQAFDGELLPTWRVGVEYMPSAVFG